MMRKTKRKKSIPLSPDIVITNKNENQKSVSQKTTQKFKFGNPFTKSSRNHKNKNKKNKNGQLFHNLAGTGLLISNDKNINERVSLSMVNHGSINNRNATPSSDDTIASSLDEKQSDRILNLSLNQSIHIKHTNGLNINNEQKYRDALKEYIDTESTISSSDIRDDISSVASDEPRRALTLPRRVPPVPPPPPPRSESIRMKIKNPKNSAKHHSQSLNTRLPSNSTTLLPNRHSKEIQNNNNSEIPALTTYELKLDMNALSFNNPSELYKKPLPRQLRKTKSAYSTPNGASPVANANKNESKQHNSMIVSPINSPLHEIAPINDSDLKNPYLTMTGNSKANVANANAMASKLPPPTSPKNKGIKAYRARTSSLPYYDMNSNRNGRRSSHSYSHLPGLHHKTQSLHGAQQLIGSAQRTQRMHNRAQSVRAIDSMTLSERIFENRRTVISKLRHGKNKKEIMNKLDVSIRKVCAKLKVYVSNKVALEDSISKSKQEMSVELAFWDDICNFEMSNLCRSYYSNLDLLNVLRMEMTHCYCQCFRDKYRELKKTYDRITRDARRYSYDDLILSVEAAMMTASNIRLSPQISEKRLFESELRLVVSELCLKYFNKKKEITDSNSVSNSDRTKHVLTMLLRVIDRDGEFARAHGLDYFHPIDNGFQSPFEQLLFDARFAQKASFDAFELRISDGNSKLSGISTLIYRTTNAFLDSLNLNRNSPFYQELFWDATNLMISRAVFPRFSKIISQIIARDSEIVNSDCLFESQLEWMSLLKCEDIGMESNTIGDYSECISNLKCKMIGHCPQDQIVMIIDTVHSIESIANKLSCHVITSDTLFPCVVYCLIQAKQCYWFKWIKQMNEFYTKKILNFGQTGFCFSMICAATQWINQQNRQDYNV